MNRRLAKLNGEKGRGYIESKGVVFFNFANMPECRDKPEALMDPVTPRRTL